MRKKSLETTICKLAIAGEHAGLTVEEMICFPQRGLSVEELLEVIALRLEKLPAFPTSRLGQAGLPSGSTRRVHSEPLREREAPTRLK